jgi:hypothetical protein
VGSIAAFGKLAPKRHLESYFAVAWQIVQVLVLLAGVDELTVGTTVKRTANAG